MTDEQVKSKEKPQEEILVRVQLNTTMGRYSIDSGHRCRYRVKMLPYEVIKECKSILEPMNEEVAKIRDKYESLMNKEIAKVQDPVLKKCKKLGVDFNGV